jgi:hypothetical protein
MGKTTLLAKDAEGQHHATTPDSVLGSRRRVALSSAQAVSYYSSARARMQEPFGSDGLPGRFTGDAPPFSRRFQGTSSVSSSFLPEKMNRHRITRDTGLRGPQLVISAEDSDTACCWLEIAIPGIACFGTGKRDKQESGTGPLLAIWAGSELT